MIKALLFDWGNTLMVDFELPGPMCDWEKVAWVEGAKEALERMMGVFPCYVASNAPQSGSDKVIAALARVGADVFFEGVYSSQDIGFEKPDERFFRYILADMKASPGELVMIGDNYLKDIEGAKNCGIRTIFLNAKAADGDFPAADGIIMKMNELPDAILDMEL